MISDWNKACIEWNFKIFCEFIPVFFHRNQIMLAGIETHICVRQTANALSEKGFDVSIIKDCCASRAESEHLAGLDIMKQEGCLIKTTEMVLFELLQSAKHPNFKDIQALIK